MAAVSVPESPCLICVIPSVDLGSTPQGAQDRQRGLQTLGIMNGTSIIPCAQFPSASPGCPVHLPSIDNDSGPTSK